MRTGTHLCLWSTNFQMLYSMMIHDSEITKGALWCIDIVEKHKTTDCYYIKKKHFIKAFWVWSAQTVKNTKIAKSFIQNKYLIFCWVLNIFYRYNSIKKLLSISLFYDYKTMTHPRRIGTVAFSTLTSCDLKAILIATCSTKLVWHLCYILRPEKITSKLPS